MRVLFFATSCLVMASEAARLSSISEAPETQLLAQTETEQLSEMATEIAQTRKENNESDKKHMGLTKYHLIQKVRKLLEQRTSASQSLTGAIERIMKEPINKKKIPPPKDKKPKTVRPTGQEK